MQDCTSQVIFYTIKNWKEQKKKKKQKILWDRVKKTYPQSNFNPITASREEVALQCLSQSTRQVKINPACYFHEPA